MPVLRPGDLLGGDGDGRCFEVDRKIGEGQFSEVYQVLDKRTGEQRAIKIEKKTDVRTIKMEYKALKRLQAGCKQTVRVYSGGEHPLPGGRFFMVMQLLGPNLSAARRNALGGQAELQAAKIIGAGMLKALEQVHLAGFIHRDVKPANFVMAPADAPSPTAASWVLIDFGLARPWQDDGGQALPERPEAAFRGSTNYASVHAHQQQDQSRRDDLWGWFYCLVELVEGTLPWRSEREAAPGTTTTYGAGGADSLQLQLLPSPPQEGPVVGEGATPQQQQLLSKGEVLQRKLECLEQPQLLITSIPCPQAVVEISNYLAQLDFSDEPDMPYLRTLLGNLDDGILAPPPVLASPAAAAAVAAAALLPPLPRAAPAAAAAASVARSGGGSRPGSRDASPGAPAERQRSRLGYHEPAQAAGAAGAGEAAGGKAPAAAAAAVEGKGADEGQRAQQRQQLSPLQKQGSRDRDRSQERGRSRLGDRSREGRSCSRSKSKERRSRSKSRSREGRSSSRSSSSSRSRSPNRDRYGSRRSRSRDRDRQRSRSRDRDRRGGSKRSRSRDRGRSQDRNRARRQRSRSREPHCRRVDTARWWDAGRRGDTGRREEVRRREEVGRRGDAPRRQDSRQRSRSRSPRGSGGGGGGGSASRLQKQQQLQQGRRREASPHAEERPASAAQAPSAAAAAQPPARTGSAVAAEAAAAVTAAATAAAAASYSVDTHIKYRAGLEYVFALRQGGLSEGAAAACKQLRALEPAEAAGTLCWLLDELATATEPRHLPSVAAFCDEIAAFAAGTARRCSERARQQ